jgi:hypothetical protein
LLDHDMSRLPIEAHELGSAHFAIEVATMTATDYLTWRHDLSAGIDAFITRTTRCVRAITKADLGLDSAFTVLVAAARPPSSEREGGTDASSLVACVLARSWVVPGPA